MIPEFDFSTGATVTAASATPTRLKLIAALRIIFIIVVVPSIGAKKLNKRRKRYHGSGRRQYDRRELAERLRAASPFAMTREENQMRGEKLARLARLKSQFGQQRLCSGPR